MSGDFVGYAEAVVQSDNKPIEGQGLRKQGASKGSAFEQVNVAEPAEFSVVGEKLIIAIRILYQVIGL